MVIIGFETFPHIYIYMAPGSVPGVLKTDGFLRVHDKGIYLYIYMHICMGLSQLV